MPGSTSFSRTGHGRRRKISSSGGRQNAQGSQLPCLRVARGQGPAESRGSLQSNDGYLTNAGKKAYGNFKAGNKELSAGFEEGVQKEQEWVKAVMRKRYAQRKGDKEEAQTRPGGNGSQGVEHRTGEERERAHGEGPGEHVQKGPRLES